MTQRILRLSTSHSCSPFFWGALTGEDHEAIEGDMVRHGQTLMVPAFTGPYLAGMAVRACTNRDDIALCCFW